MKTITRTVYQNAIDAVSQVIKQQQPSLDIKKGSTIRELVVRPFAYCYSFVLDMINNWIKQTSLYTLSKNTSSISQVVDTITSNFFVQRKTGTYAKGYITLTLSTSSIRIGTNTKFDIDGRVFVTQKTYIASIQNNVLNNTQTIEYLKIITIKQDEQYRVNVPVTAVDIGALQIPAGVEVNSFSQLTGVQNIQLLSPITGGYDQQDDASLIQRCRYSICNSIGTLDSIKQKLLNNNSVVMSCNALDSGTAICGRARLNNYAIAMPGVVDLFVKTQNQAIVATLQKLDTQEVQKKAAELKNLGLNQDINYYKVQISASQYPQYSAILEVNNVSTIYNDQKKDLKYYAVFNDIQDRLILNKQSLSLYQKAYRLSKFQKTCIYIPADQLYINAESLISISFKYIPYINEVQQLLDSTDNKFLGIDILVRAAIPVELQLTADLQIQQQLQQSQIKKIKQSIAASINSMQVGISVLNMDTISRKLQKEFPSCRLKVPYYISASILLPNGQRTSINSNTGVLDLNKQNNLNLQWGSQLYYFSITPNSINIKLV